MTGLVKFIKSFTENPVYLFEKKLEKEKKSGFKLMSLLWLLNPIVQFFIFIFFYLTISYYDYFDDEWFVFYFACYVIQSVYFLIRLIPKGSHLLSADSALPENVELTPLQIIKGKFMSLFSPLVTEMAVLYLIVFIFFLTTTVNPLIMLFLFITQIFMIAALTLIILNLSSRSKSFLMAEISATAVSAIYLFIHWHFASLFYISIPNIEQTFQSIPLNCSGIHLTALYSLMSIILSLLIGIIFYGLLSESVFITQCDKNSPNKRKEALSPG